MKKLVAFLLAVVMMFSLVGCSGSGEKEEKEDASMKFAVIFGLGGL